ncbi:phage tail length tape measure family protein [Nitrobacter sp.]|uniref:phage tail length tape measure family protein n=1 Tax=Nitrobacter sp. TaxID=29420 RepID=UPI003F64E5A9
MADNEQLVLSISADTRAMQRQLDKLVKQIGDVDNSAAQAFTKTPAKIDDVTKSIGKTRFETANLAAQFQDIAVQLQGGQSPFTVALQQGTQINQVIGQHGAAGAVALLGSAFKSLLTPTSLATIGIIALGGAAIQYGAKAIGAVDDLDDKLKAHAEAIKALKDAYGEAGKGVDTAVHEAVAVLQVLAGFKTTDLQKELNSLSKSLSFSLQSSVEWQRNLAMQAGQTADQFGKSFGSISSAVDTFARSVASGKPDIQSLRVALANIISSDADKGLKDMASNMLNMTERASGVALEIDRAAKAVQKLNFAQLDAIQGAKDFQKALGALNSTVSPNLSDREKILKNYNDAMAKAKTQQDRFDAAAGRANQLAILSANELKKSIEDQGKAAESSAKRFLSSINSVSKRNAQLKAGTPTIGRGVRALSMMEAM